MRKNKALLILAIGLLAGFVALGSATRTPFNGAFHTTPTTDSSLTASVEVNTQLWSRTRPQSIAQPSATGPVDRFRVSNLIRETIKESTDSAETQQGLEDREDDADVILDRIRWFKDRHPEIEPELRLKIVSGEYQEREARKKRIAAGTESVQTSWTALGPTNGAGRISSVAVHPTAMGTVYVGADGGGVWKTTDGGNTWTNLTDSINNLNVGAIALAPSSPNIVYVGTGSEHSSGIGLLKSTDGGNTWQFPATVVATRFWRISVHPTNPLELIAATDRGGLRSIDGGQTWSTVLVTSQFFSCVQDLKRDPNNPSIVYAVLADNGSTGGVFFKSTNGGVSWTQKTAGLPTNSDFMSIAITPSNSQVLYVFTSIQSGVSHIYKSTDSAETWNDLPGVSANPEFSISHVLGGQAFHDNAIVVSPSNQNTILALGVFAIRSTDGGATWGAPPFTRSDSPHCETGVHADTTDLQYQGTNLYIVGDGGVFSTPDSGDTAFAHNKGLVIREYYSISNTSSITRSMFFGGSQDNGTDRRSGAGGTLWTNVMNGDGFDCAISTTTPSTAYATIQGGLIFRTKQAGTVDQCQFEDQNIGPHLPAGESGPFFTKLVMDFSNPSTLYTLSNLRVWRTIDGGNSWAPLPTTTTDGSTWEVPFIDYRIVVSRSNSNVLMTSNGGIIFRSTDGGTTWVKKTTPGCCIYSLEIDPTDSSTAYIGSYGGGSSDGFFMTTDGGTNWLPRNNGLPQGPVLVVRVDPLNSNTLYCGTYSGVYISTDRGLNWNPLGTGLPSIYIEDLRVTDDGALLRAATYGRGVWEFQLRPTAPPVGISGKVSDSASNPISGATLTLGSDGSAIATTQSDSGGNYAFSDLDAGHNYSVTPAKLQYIFSPHDMSFNNLSSNQSGNFTGTFTNATYEINGKVTAPNGSPITGVLVLLGGTPYGSGRFVLFTNGSGDYSFTNLVAGGDYNLQPDNSRSSPPYNNYTFSPSISNFYGLNSNKIANFVASDPFAPTANAATNVTSNGFTANWSTVGGVNGYRLDISTNSSFGSYLSGYQDLDVGNVLSSSVTGLSAGTSYFYRVRAYNAGGPSGNSGTITVTTTTAPPPAPTANAATNVTSSSFTTNWSSSSGATGYRLDVSTSNTFSSYLSGYQDLDVGNVLSSSVSGLSAGTPYFYRVRAYNTGGPSGNSGSITVTTTTAPPPAPTANAATNVTSSSFMTNWSSSGGATGYRLDVSTSNTFSSYLSGYQDLDVGNVLSRSVSGLNAGTTYYYRLRAYNAGGTSGNSGTISVTTAVQITVQSNPTGRSFTIDGLTYTSTQTFQSTSGSSHTLSTTSQQSGATGTQYLWSNWSDGGAINHTVAPSSNATYTANFTTQYFLTMNAGTGGAVNPSSGWYNSGIGVGISATPNANFTFTSWTGSGSGSFTGASNPVNIAINGPITETASFVAVPETVQFSPATYAMSEGGQLLNIIVTRSGDTTSGASVNFATSDSAGIQNCNVFNGIASSRCDYISALSTVSFAAGEASKTVSVLIVDDSYAEGNETFTLSLSNASGASLGTQSTATVTILDNDSVTGSNPTDAANSFVRQHYLDFLNRQPDASGLAFWTNEITSCGTNQSCIDVKRINVSAAFFLSIEFQGTGYLVERIYKTAYGDATGTSTFNGVHQLAVPIIRLNEFLADTQQIGLGVVVGQGNWQQQLEDNKNAFATEFVQRTRFQTAYATSLTPEQFVDQLFQNAGVTPSASERTTAINEFSGAADTSNLTARSRALRDVAENVTLTTNEFNRAFVLMQYFGYLRRNPNDPQDIDYTGYDFWLTKLNNFTQPGDVALVRVQKADMVKAFIVSAEYRGRFGP